MIPLIFTSSHDYRRGSVFGLGIEIPLATRISLDIGALYYQKGTKFTVLDLEGKEVYSHMFRLKSASLPVGLKVKFLRGFSPYVLGGCEFSHIVGHEQVLSSSRT